MQLLLDNLVATTVAGVVLFLLAAVSLDRAEGTRDATRFYAHQRVQTEFVRQLERDLVDAGAGVPVGATPVLAADADSVRFYGVVDTLGTPGTVAYSWRPGGTLDGSPVWSVQRWSNGARSGGAVAVLSAFDVTFVSDGGVAVGPATLDQARAVRVETEWVLPHLDEEPGAERRQALRRSAYSTTVRPLGLQP